MSTRIENWPPQDAEAVEPHPDAPAPGTQLGEHYSECFGCGHEVESGLHLRSTVSDDMSVVSTFTVKKDHQGAPGLAHGGLLACAFDEALGSTVGNLLRTPTVTARLETDFVRPVPVGSTLHIAAKLDGRSGRKTYVSAEGRLDAADGPVALRARGLFVTVGVDHFTTHGDPDALAKFRQTKEAGQAEDRDWDVNP
ncbi:PaaI family thioesterase [Prauserella rugosa]|uniref:Acyl-coenzyme A thioesterase THEM4 n=1 Tax=Prauserella rugosa TaxID=43354 RepID=A0A660CCR5_9PSEU|nr:PaaI family thioesterase [Prauserella rugosa]KID29125.1 thioesterase superfamily enzyme [Prauserella sp. Am3]KMS91872.1 thioesterase [Streptomyces regensis]TWH21340.1 thioesterase superfamily protein [Prauserella rugosa]